MSLPESYYVVAVRVGVGVVRLDVVKESSGHFVGLRIQLPVGHLLPSLGVDQSHGVLDVLVVYDAMVVYEPVTRNRGTLI